MKKYEMIAQPTRGKLKEGLSFGYVDVPKTITENDRPFLDGLTKASLDLQKEIRKDIHIDIKTVDTSFTSKGLETKVRVFIPGDDGPYPLVMYYHGGGFALRNVDCFDFIGRYISSNGGAVVVMPEYALSPENKFSVAVEQCYDALLWARDNAKKYHANSSIDIVMGDSAGGNISIVVAMMCRDRGICAPKKQILAYPVVDQSASIDRESQRLYGEQYNLDYKHLISYSQAYVKKEADLFHPYCSPLFTNSLSGLPACLMILAECDVLIDQGLEYAKRLHDSEIKVEYEIYIGMPHDFLFYGFEESYQAYDRICGEIKKLD